VTPLVAERQALVAAGFTSAQSIARMAKGSFVTTYRETLGVERAQTIHANASQASAAASTLWARYSPQLNYPLIPSLGWLDGSVMAPALQQQGVDFTKLFGSLDSCACDDCRSIHGPAAYLVDLLQFIGGNGFSQLDARRPDLKLTELTCANTNTPMPYIDLANEVLENAVAPPGGTPSWPQTTWSAEELLAGPEHVNQGAYDTLKAAVYPWTLPFDLAEEEAEVYLAHLGVDRAELMETFASSSPSETTIAAVRLDLTSVDWKIITTAPSGSDPAAYWGPSGAPVVSSVDAFLQQAGLSYDELLDLLWTDFVNPGQKVTVTFNDTSCNLSNAQLWSSGSTAQPLQPADAFFARLHRFTRLRRKLGWTAFELDAAIRAFAPADLTEAFVVKLADLQALKRALGADLLDMLAWWGHLDTRARPDGAPSFYESIFQNKTAISQIDLAYFAIQALTGTGTQTLLTLASTIAAAIGVSADDLALLTDSVAADGIGLASPEIADTSLSLANLTGLYRVVSLARALKLTIRQLIVLRALTGIDPFDATDTKKARALLSALAVVKSSPFKLQEPALSR